jgi:hypothetical protein
VLSVVLSILRANKLFKNLHKQVYRHYQVSNGKPLMTYRKQDSNLRPRVMSPTSQPLLYPASLVFACVNVKRRKLAAGGGFELPIVPFGVGLSSALMGLLSMEWRYFCPMLSVLTVRVYRFCSQFCSHWWLLDGVCG